MVSKRGPRPFGAIWGFRAADMVTTFQENSSKDFFFEFLSVSWNKECKFTKILGRTTAAIYIQPENHEDIEIWHLPGRFLTTGFYYENILNHFRVSSHSYHILHPWVRPADQDFSGVIIAVPAQPTQHRSHGYNISKSCQSELDPWVSEYQSYNQVSKIFQI